VIGYSNGRYDEQQHQKVIAAQERAHDQRQPDQQIDTDRAGLPYFARAIASNPEPEDAPERERRDLAAQESMSVWAFWMTFLSAGQLVLSGLGLVALLITIGQGREALKRARKANRITRTLGRAQIKAYLSLSSIVPKLDETKNFLTISWNIKNAGGTPAKSCEIVSFITAYGTNGKIKEQIVSYKTHEIMVGEHSTGHAPCRIISMTEWYFANRFEVLIETALYYRDMFGREATHYRKLKSKKGHVAEHAPTAPDVIERRITELDAHRLSKQGDGS
jgi:hypothetical protein